MKGKLLLHAKGESLLREDLLGEGQASGEVSVMGSFAQSLPHFPAGRPAMVLHARALLGDNPTPPPAAAIALPADQGGRLGEKAAAPLIPPFQHLTPF